MRKPYLFLAVAGLVLPYCFASFLLENGCNLPLRVEQLFARDISSFFAVYLVSTALVCTLFMYQETRKLKCWSLSALATPRSTLRSLSLFLSFRAGPQQVVTR